MRIVAHRGASALAPENTFAAFDAAMQLRAGGVRVDALETDVHLTADGVAVCIHDRTLDRTTSGTGIAGAITAAAMRELDAGSWFAAAFAHERVPCLSDFVQRFILTIELCIEVKDPAAVAAVVDVLNRIDLSLLRRVELSSFDWPVLQQLRTRLPGVPQCYLVEQLSMEAIDSAASVGIACIGPPLRGAHGAAVEYARQRGLTVRLWGVTTTDAVQAARELCVDALTLDDPRLAT